MAMTNELHHVKQALAEASNEAISLKKQYATALRKLDKHKKSHDSTVGDFMASEMTIERLKEENVELKQILSEFQESKKCLESGPIASCKQAIVTKDKSMHQLLESFIIIDYQIESRPQGQLKL